MDPVTIAILAAITAGAAKGTVEAAADAAAKPIVSGYAALKALLRRKFGSSSEVIEAVDKLEKAPGSTGRRQTLGEQLAAVKAADDPELLSAAQALLDQIKAQPGGERHLQMAQGIGIAQADRGGTATVNVSGNIPGRKDG
jgi:hypothetical protein